MQIVYFSPTQLNAQVPATAATGNGSFTVTAPLGAAQKGTIAISAVAPGLFSANGSGKGPAAAYVQSVVTQDAPIPVFTCPSPPMVCLPNPFDVSTGTTALVLYGTGIRNRTQLSAVTAIIGGITLPVFYAGPAPGIFGGGSGQCFTAGQPRSCRDCLLASRHRQRDVEPSNGGNPISVTAPVESVARIPTPRALKVPLVPR
jgi:hypothetical protein